MKNKLLLLLSSCFIVSTGYAESKGGDNKKSVQNYVLSNGSAVIKIKGSFEFLSAYSKNDSNSEYTKDKDKKAKLEESRHLSGNAKDYAFDSSGSIKLEGEYKTDDDIAYGGVFGIKVTSKNNRSTPSWIYASSPEYGKIELGSGKSANAQMKVHGSKVAVGLGCSVSDWAIIDPMKTGIYYTNSMAGYLDSKTRTSVQGEYARKITYFTPQYQGLQFGVSFVPDTSNIGSYSNANHQRHDVTGKNLGYNLDVKSGVAYALSYETKVKDDLKIKVVFGAEHGSVAPKKKDTTMPDLKFNNLFAYIVGAEVGSKDLTFAFGYQDQGSSLAPKNHNSFKGSSKLYDFGVKYKINEKVSTSLIYFNSDSFGNKLNYYTAGLEYKIFPGVASYVEFSRFETDGKLFDEKLKKDQKDSNKGTVIVAGVKLEV